MQNHDKPTLPVKPAMMLDENGHYCWATPRTSPEEGLTLVMNVCHLSDTPESGIETLVITLTAGEIARIKHLAAVAKTEDLESVTKWIYHGDWSGVSYADLAYEDVPPDDCVKAVIAEAEKVDQEKIHVSRKDSHFSALPKINDHQNLMFTLPVALSVLDSDVAMVDLTEW